jgi:hypothetical protein
MTALSDAPWLNSVHIVVMPHFENVHYKLKVVCKYFKMCLLKFRYLYGHALWPSFKVCFSLLRKITEIFICMCL